MLYSLKNIDEVAKKILTLSKHKILLLKGEMGVGKTTLTKAIANQLGVKEMANSPTFSLVNEYQLNDGVLYHFDLFRLNELSEAYDIGIEEYLDSGNICLIEWPEKIIPILPEYHVIKLEWMDEQTRKLKFS